MTARIDPVSYGYGLALAMDADPSSYVGKLVRLKQPSLHGPVTVAGTVKRVLADGRLEIKLQLGGYVVVSTEEATARDETVVPSGGANAKAHGAKHMTARAEVAGKAGFTGGPPTHKGTGASSAKVNAAAGRFKVPSGINWPSKDATPKGFWSYQAASATPSLSDAIAAKAIRADTTQAEWDKLTPGMKREIVRSAGKSSKDAAPVRLDKYGNEIEEMTDADRAELERIKRTGERLPEYSSAGAVRKRPRPR